MMALWLGMASALAAEAPLTETGFAKQVVALEARAVAARDLAELRAFLDRSIQAVDARADDEAARLRGTAMRLKEYLAPLDPRALKSAAACAQGRTAIRRAAGPANPAVEAPAYLPGEARAALALLDRLCSPRGGARVSR